MSLSAIVEALVEAGATPQMILAAVRAHEGSATEAVEQRRRSDAERQARRRERARHVTSRDVTVTERDTPLPLPSSPQTPQQPTPTPENNTRPRKAALGKPEIAALVDQVWALQPVTGGKRKATRPDVARALQSALDRGGSAEAIVAALTAYYRLPDCRKDGGQFARGAEVMLNADRWKDFLPSAEPQDLSDQPVDPAVQARRLRHWRDTGAWDPGWGARPAHPANDAPSSQTGAAA